MSTHGIVDWVADSTGWWDQDIEFKTTDTGELVYSIEEIQVNATDTLTVVTTVGYDAFAAVSGF